MRFAISGPATWVALGCQLVKVEGERPTGRLQTGLFGTEPSFDANSRGCFHLDHEWLVDGAGGTRVGKVLEGQTWFRVGEKLGFGFYRAGLLTFYFLFRPGRAGLLDIALPPMDGRLLSVSAVFDEEHVLFSTLVEKGGRERASLFLVGSDGGLVASLSGSPEESECLSSVEGKALLGGRILCAAEQGLLSLHVDRKSKTIGEGTFFTDTEPFVQGGARLLPGPGGSVYVVTERRVSQLSLA